MYSTKELLAYRKSPLVSSSLSALTTLHNDMHLEIRDIFKSTRIGDLEAVRYLIHHDHIDINIRNDIGQTPLHLAVISRKHAMVKFLVEEAKADLNISDLESKWTPLHHAMYHGITKIVCILIQNGAIMDFRDMKDKDRIRIEMKTSRKKSKLLLDYDGLSALDLSSYRRKEYMQDFLRRGLVPSDLNIIAPKTYVKPNKLNKRGMAKFIPSPYELSCGELYSFGKCDYQLGYVAAPGGWTVQKRPRRIDAINGCDVVHMSIAKDHGVAVTKAGRIYAWGNGRGGRLTNLVSVIHMEPVILEHPVLTKHHITVVAAAKGYTLALSNQGNVYSWGIKSSMLALGHGRRNESFDTSIPRRIEALKKYTIVGIAASPSHCLAYSAKGVAYTWGDNKHFQLGPRSTKALGIPKPITLNYHRRLSTSVSTNVTNMSSLQSSSTLESVFVTNGDVSPYFTVVVSRDGMVWQWGYGCKTPLKVSFETTECRRHVLKKPNHNNTTLRANITAATANHNNNNNVPSYSQLCIRKVSCSKSHCVAVSTSGDVFSWGFAEGDILGHYRSSSTSSSSRGNFEPTDKRQQIENILPISSDKMSAFLVGRLVKSLRNIFVIDVSVADTHSAVASDTGDVFTWGHGDQGALGHSLGMSQHKARRVGRLKGVTKIAVANNCTLVLVQPLSPSLPVSMDGMYSEWEDAFSFWDVPATILDNDNNTNNNNNNKAAIRFRSTEDSATDDGDSSDEVDESSDELDGTVAITTTSTTNNNGAQGEHSSLIHRHHFINSKSNTDTSEQQVPSLFILAQKAARKLVNPRNVCQMVSFCSFYNANLLGYYCVEWIHFNFDILISLGKLSELLNEDYGLPFISHMIRGWNENRPSHVSGGVVSGRENNKNENLSSLPNYSSLEVIDVLRSGWLSEYKATHSIPQLAITSHNNNNDYSNNVDNSYMNHFSLSDTTTTLNSGEPVLQLNHQDEAGIRNLLRRVRNLRKKLSQIKALETRVVEAQEQCRVDTIIMGDASACSWDNTSTHNSHQISMIDSLPVPSPILSGRSSIDVLSMSEKEKLRKKGYFQCELAAIEPMLEAVSDLLPCSDMLTNEIRLVLQDSIKSKETGKSITNTKRKRKKKKNRNVIVPDTSTINSISESKSNIPTVHQTNQKEIDISDDDMSLHNTAKHDQLTLNSNNNNNKNNSNTNSTSGSGTGSSVPCMRDIILQEKIDKKNGQTRKKTQTNKKHFPCSSSPRPGPILNGVQDSHNMLTITKTNITSKTPSSVSFRSQNNSHAKSKSKKNKGEKTQSSYSVDESPNSYEYSPKSVTLLDLMRFSDTNSHVTTPNKKSHKLKLAGSSSSRTISKSFKSVWGVRDTDNNDIKSGASFLNSFSLGASATTNTVVSSTGGVASGSSNNNNNHNNNNNNNNNNNTSSNGSSNYITPIKDILNSNKNKKSGIKEVRSAVINCRPASLRGSSDQKKSRSNKQCSMSGASSNNKGFKNSDKKPVQVDLFTFLKKFPHTKSPIVNPWGTSPVTGGGQDTISTCVDGSNNNNTNNTNDNSSNSSFMDILKEAETKRVSLCSKKNKSSVNSNNKNKNNLRNSPSCKWGYFPNTNGSGEITSLLDIQAIEKTQKENSDVTMEKNLWQCSYRNTKHQESKVDSNVSASSSNTRKKSKQQRNKSIKNGNNYYQSKKKSEGNILIKI